MRAKVRFIGVLTVLAGLFATSTAWAVNSLQVSWDPSPDEVAGYAIWYGLVGGSQTNMVDVGANTNAVVQNIDETKTYFFYATAYDSERVESDPSEVITYGSGGTPPSSNTPPTLAAIPDVMADEGKQFQMTLTASDSDTPAQTLVYSLGNAPTGLSIDTARGILTWTPSSTQAPSTNNITVKVTDNGTPAQSATRTFTATVRSGFMLTINSADGGTAQTSPKGTLNTAGTKYINGTQVGVTAKPANGYAFDRWTVNGSTFTANPLNIMMNQNITITPYFKLLGILSAGQ